MMKRAVMILAAGSFVIGLACAAGWWFGSSELLDRLPYWAMTAIIGVLCGVPILYYCYEILRGPRGG